jgi:hypothetical protein
VGVVLTTFLEDGRFGERRSVAPLTLPVEVDLLHHLPLDRPLRQELLRQQDLSIQVLQTIPQGLFTLYLLAHPQKQLLDLFLTQVLIVCP